MFVYNYHLPFIRFFRINARCKHTAPLLRALRKLRFEEIVNLAKSAISANNAQVAGTAAGAEFTRMIIFPYIS
jgi:hypothetical protein